jgi:hypothetical protein
MTAEHDGCSALDRVLLAFASFLEGGEILDRKSVV